MWIHIEMKICIKVKVSNFSFFLLGMPLFDNFAQCLPAATHQILKWDPWNLVNMKTLENKDAHVSLFLDLAPYCRVMPLLMIYYKIFLPFLLQILWNLLYGFGIRKEVRTYFPVFPGRVLGLSYAPLKFSKEKSLLWLLHQNHLMEFLEFK